jgi:hypothetical protein
MKTYWPKSPPYLQTGGQHPAGCVLSYALTKQPSGLVRMDCYKDDEMVLCMYNMTEKEAELQKHSFMSEGHHLNPVLIRRKK